MRVGSLFLEVFCCGPAPDRQPPVAHGAPDQAPVPAPATPSAWWRRMLCLGAEDGAQPDIPLVDITHAPVPYTGPQPPRLDVSERFTRTDLGAEGVRYLYLDPYKTSHGLEAVVSPEGVLRLDVQAGGYSAKWGGGRDMVHSLMKRLHLDGVAVQSVTGLWYSDRESVNHVQCAAALAGGASLAHAAMATWTAGVFGEHGFTRVASAEDVSGPPQRFEVVFVKPAGVVLSTAA